MQSAADLRVVVGGEDLGVAGLALVAPSIGLGRADTIKTGKAGDLAEPATDEDVLEVVSAAGGEDLAVGAGVELVDHLSVAGHDGVHGVGLELGAVLEGLHAHLRAPLVDNALVTIRGRGGSRRSSAGWLRSWRRLVGGLSRSLVVGTGGRSWRRLNVGGRDDGSLVSWLGGGGRLSDLVTLGLSDVHGVDNGLNDDVDVLDLLLGAAVVGNGEGRAGKGSHGKGECGAHLD